MNLVVTNILETSNALVEGKEYFAAFFGIHCDVLEYLFLYII